MMHDERIMNDVVIWWNDPHVCFVYSACLFIESGLFKAPCFRYRCCVSFYVECAPMVTYVWMVTSQVDRFPAKTHLTHIFVYPIFRAGLNLLKCDLCAHELHMFERTLNFRGLKTEPS